LAIGTRLRIIHMKVKIVGIICPGRLVAKRIDVSYVVSQNLKPLGKAFQRGNSIVEGRDHFLTVVGQTDASDALRIVILAGNNHGNSSILGFLDRLDQTRHLRSFF
jgi:hypothetical protein